MIMILFIKKDRPRLQQNRPAPSSAKKTGSIFSQKDRLRLRNGSGRRPPRPPPVAAPTPTHEQKRPAPSSAKKTGSVFSKKDRLRLQQKKTSSVFSKKIPAPSSAKKDRLRLQQKSPAPSSAKRLALSSAKKTGSVFSKKDRLRPQQKRLAPSSAIKHWLPENADILQPAFRIPFGHLILPKNSSLSYQCYYYMTGYQTTRQIQTLNSMSIFDIGRYSKKVPYCWEGMQARFAGKGQCPLSQQVPADQCTGFMKLCKNVKTVREPLYLIKQRLM